MTNFDHLSDRLRKRVTAPRSDYNLGACWSCNVVLTSADLEAGRCTNCEMGVESDDGDSDSSDCRERGIDG